MASGTGLVSAVYSLSNPDQVNKTMPPKDFLSEVPAAVELSVPSTIEYKGYIIRASPYMLLDPKGWSLNIHVEKHSDDGIVSRNFYASNIFNSKDDAVKNCLFFGKKIIDGRYPNLNVSGMN